MAATTWNDANRSAQQPSSRSRGKVMTATALSTPIGPARTTPGLCGPAGPPREGVSRQPSACYGSRPRPLSGHRCTSRHWPGSVPLPARSQGNAQRRVERVAQRSFLAAEGLAQAIASAGAGFAADCWNAGPARPGLRASTPSRRKKPSMPAHAGTRERANTGRPAASPSRNPRSTGPKGANWSSSARRSRLRRSVSVLFYALLLPLSGWGQSRRGAHPEAEAAPSGN